MKTLDFSNIAKSLRGKTLKKSVVDFFKKEWIPEKKLYLQECWYENCSKLKGFTNSSSTKMSFQKFFNHQLFLPTVEKKCLINFDWKRYTLKRMSQFRLVNVLKER